MTLDEIAARYKMNPAVLMQMIKNGQINKSVYEIDAGKLYIHPLAFDAWHTNMVKMMNRQQNIQRMDRISKITALVVAAAMLIVAFALAIMTGMWSWLAVGSVFAVLAWGLFQFAGSVLAGFMYGNQTTIPCMQLQGAGTPCTGDDLNMQMMRNLEQNILTEHEDWFDEQQKHSFDLTSSLAFSHSAGNLNHDNSWSDPH